MSTIPDVLDIQLRYADFDDQGVLNNAVYLTLFELGRINFMMGVLENSLFRLRLIVAHVEVDYLKPVKIGNTVFCRTLISSIGNTSVTFSQELLFKENGESAARAKCVAVVIDTNGKKLPVPSILRDRLRGEK